MSERSASALRAPQANAVIRKLRITAIDSKNCYTPHYSRAIIALRHKAAAEVARAHSESEFGQCRVVQDRLYQSDFDRLGHDVAESAAAQDAALQPKKGGRDAA